MLRGGHKVYSKFLSIEVVDSIHIEAWRRISLPELYFSKEYFTSFSAEVKADYKQYTKNLYYNL